MNQPLAPMSLIAAIRHFFGFKPGQTMSDFAVEVKALSDADRAYFRQHLTTAGYTITN